MSTFWWVLSGLWVMAGLLAAIYWRALARARWSWLGVWLLGGVGWAMGLLPKDQAMGSTEYWCLPAEVKNLELEVGRGKVWVVEATQYWYERVYFLDAGPHGYRLPAECNLGAAFYQVKGNSKPSFTLEEGVLRVATQAVPRSDLNLALVLPAGAGLENLRAWLGEGDLGLIGLAQQNQIEVARGRLEVWPPDQVTSQVAARIGSGNLDLDSNYAGEIQVEAGYLRAYLGIKGGYGRIQAQTGDITILSSSSENPRYRSSRAISTDRGDPAPRRVGDYYELGPEGAPVMTIELERGSVRAY